MVIYSINKSLKKGYKTSRARLNSDSLFALRNETFLCQVLLDKSVVAAVWVYGSLGFSAALCAILLPIETKGRILPVSFIEPSVDVRISQLFSRFMCNLCAYRGHGSNITGKFYETQCVCMDFSAFLAALCSILSPIETKCRILLVIFSEPG